MDPDFKNYAEAVKLLKVKGVTIAKATDEDLSDIFKAMQVTAIHRVELREAVSGWGADSQEVKSSAVLICSLQNTLAFLKLPPSFPSALERVV